MRDQPQSDDHSFPSQELLDYLKLFIQDNSIARIQNSLRTVFFDYLRYNHEALQVEFENVLDDIQALLKLTTLIGEESKTFTISKV